MFAFKGYKGWKRRNTAESPPEVWRTMPRTLLYLTARGLCNLVKWKRQVTITVGFFGRARTGLAVNTPEPLEIGAERGVMHACPGVHTDTTVLGSYAAPWWACQRCPCIVVYDIQQTIQGSMAPYTSRSRRRVRKVTELDSGVVAPRASLVWT